MTTSAVDCVIPEGLYWDLVDKTDDKMIGLDSVAITNQGMIYTIRSDCGENCYERLYIETEYVIIKQQAWGDMYIEIKKNGIPKDYNPVPKDSWLRDNIYDQLHECDSVCRVSSKLPYVSVYSLRWLKQFYPGQINIDVKEIRFECLISVLRNLANGLLSDAIMSMKDMFEEYYTCGEIEDINTDTDDIFYFDPFKVKIRDLSLTMHGCFICSDISRRFTEDILREEECQEYDGYRDTIYGSIVYNTMRQIGRYLLLEDMRSSNKFKNSKERFNDKITTYIRGNIVREEVLRSEYVY